jgi:hypothetical protein
MGTLAVLRKDPGGFGRVRTSEGNRERSVGDGTRGFQGCLRGYGTTKGGFY